MDIFMYIYLFVIGFVAGIIIASLTVWKGKRRKKGFRKGRFYGSGQEIDQRITEDINTGQKMDILHDTMEYHANKKFK